MKKIICLLMTVMMVVSLAGCGAKETKDNAEPTAETETQGTSEEADPAEEAEVDLDAVKVGLCLSGSINDQGWNQTAYEGALKACEKYGYELNAAENLTTADIAQAYADFANDGYQVIIGHGYEFGEPALEVAELYPDVKFIITEADASAENVASYVMACEQTAYVEGIIAANMTETNVIGAIGPIPGDSLVKILNGFEDGAKSVNPDITFIGSWTNDFVDTQIAMEHANAMIEKKADVIKHCANACGNGAMQAAVDADIWCMGDSYDQSSLAPENILDSALYNLDVVLDIALGTVNDGTFKGEVYNLGMAEGAVELLLSDNLPDDVKAIAEDTIEQIKSGAMTVERDYTLRQQ